MRGIKYACEGAGVACGAAAVGASVAFWPTITAVMLCGGIAGYCKDEVEEVIKEIDTRLANKDYRPIGWNNPDGSPDSFGETPTVTVPSPSVSGDHTIITPISSSCKLISHEITSSHGDVWYGTEVHCNGIW